MFLREHRRWLINHFNKPLDEMEDLDLQFKIDNKNYHAWG